MDPPRTGTAWFRYYITTRREISGEHKKSGTQSAASGGRDGWQNMALLAAAEQVAHEWMHDPEGSGRLAFARELISDPERAWLTDAFGQPSGGWTPGQLAGLYHLYSLWFVGELAITRLPINCSPGYDSQREENQAALNALRLITEPDNPGLSATVFLYQMTSPDGDGVLRWERPITLGMRIPDDPGGSAWAVVDPMPKVPLEIGSTDTSTTVMHLLQNPGVARWPYGSEHVVLIVSSTFVREAYREDDTAVRWKPGPMRMPAFR